MHVLRCGVCGRACDVLVVCVVVGVGVWLCVVGVIGEFGSKAGAVSGSGYLISRKSIPCLYKAGLDTSFLNLEDVFITGLAASACHIKLINSRWFNFIGKNSRRVKNHDILVHNVRNSSEMAFIFKKLHQFSDHSI